VNLGHPPWGTPRLLTVRCFTTVEHSHRRGRGKGKNGPWATQPAKSIGLDDFAVVGARQCRAPTVD